jgi:hypothetical protein
LALFAILGNMTNEVGHETTGSHGSNPEKDIHRATPSLTQRQPVLDEAAPNQIVMVRPSSSRHRNICSQDAQSLPPAAMRRLMREISELKNSPPEGIRISTNEDNMLDVTGIIQGPGECATVLRRRRRG